MSHTLTIDKQLKIIRYTHQGIIERKDLDAAWEDILKLKEFTELGYNLLSDYRHSEFKMGMKHAFEIIEFLSSIKHIVRGKRQSILVDDPYSTAGSLLFEKYVNMRVGFKVKTFTTEKAAMHWVCC